MVKTCLVAFSVNICQSSVMPKALQVDKEVIKALVLQGLKVDDIAMRYGVKAGTIHTWVNREDWKGVKARTIEVLQSTQKPLLSDQVAQASVLTRNIVAERIKQAAETIPIPKSYRQAMKQQADMEVLVRNGEKAFQWSQTGSSSMVSIHSLSSDTPQGQLDISSASPPVTVK